MSTTLVGPGTRSRTRLVALGFLARPWKSCTRAVTSWVAPISTTMPRRRAALADRRCGRIVVSLSRRCRSRRRAAARPARPGRGRRQPHRELRGRRARLAVPEAGRQRHVVRAGLGAGGDADRHLRLGAARWSAAGTRRASPRRGRRAAWRSRSGVKFACGDAAPAYLTGNENDASPPWAAVWAVAARTPRSRVPMPNEPDPSPQIVVSGGVRRVVTEEPHVTGRVSGAVGVTRREPTRIDAPDGAREGRFRRRPVAASRRPSR